MALPPYYLEIILSGRVACVDAMNLYRGRSLIMPSAGSTGTEVNRSVKSYELRHSPGINVTLLACSTALGVVVVVGGTCLPAA